MEPRRLSLRYGSAEKRFHGGKGWAGEQQLMKEWAELEWKLVHIYTTLQVNPVLSPALEEEMYPLPSKFGYT